jgi:hypothetical protein
VLLVAVVAPCVVLVVVVLPPVPPTPDVALVVPPAPPAEVFPPDDEVDVVPPLETQPAQTTMTIQATIARGSTRMSTLRSVMWPLWDARPFRGVHGIRRPLPGEVVKVGVPYCCVPEIAYWPVHAKMLFFTTACADPESPPLGPMTTA